jgi:hypothetical protein
MVRQSSEAEKFDDYTGLKVMQNISCQWQISNLRLKKATFLNLNNPAEVSGAAYFHVGSFPHVFFNYKLSLGVHISRDFSAQFT